MRKNRSSLLRMLIIAGLFAANQAPSAVAQGCRCSEWDGFRRICVPCPDANGGISDEDREALREQRRRYQEAREAERRQRAAIRTNARIDALIKAARTDLAAGRDARALDRLWQAYNLNPLDPALRANVVRVVLADQLARGQQALARGDDSAVDGIQRSSNQIFPLLQTGVRGVDDEADLILQSHELESIMADLRQAAQDRRRREVWQRLEDPSDALVAQRLREDALQPIQLTWLWATGSGPRDYSFGPDHQVTQDLRNSAHGRLVRYLLYQKYRGRPRNGDSFTGYRAAFGLYGLFTTRTLSEQFVGSFRVDAEVIDGRIRYTATNTTSFTSFLYGIGPSWEGRTLRPMSNMRQTYVWWEPVQRLPGSR
jgi:hypothetical protein